MEKTDFEKINLEILSMKKMLVSIQGFIEDSFLTPEEETLIEQSLSGKSNLISLKDMKVQLKL